MPPWTELAAVRWQAAAKLATALTSSGVAHGFFGVGDQPPAAHFVRQIHGTSIAKAEPSKTDAGATARLEADGIYTSVKGESVAVRTADCLPVLMIAPGRLAMAVHAGWRGLTSGILARAVAVAGEQGVGTGELQVAIGPAISREQFEVGFEVVDALYAAPIGLTDEEASLCVAKGLRDRWHVDLSLAATLTLLRQGVIPDRITVIQACTRTSATWHSYRREGKGVASNWSWITL